MNALPHPSRTAQNALSRARGLGKATQRAFRMDRGQFGRPYLHPAEGLIEGSARGLNLHPVRTGAGEVIK